MKNEYIIVIVGVVALVFVWLYAAGGDGTPEAAAPEEAGYETISAAELENMLAGGTEVMLIDVHTPEQEHIPGTDLVIPYDQIDAIESELDGAETAVVLYCRSGSMSMIAAEELAGRGYTNVHILQGGLNEWMAGGGRTLPAGSVPVSE